MKITHKLISILMAAAVAVTSAAAIGGGLSANAEGKSGKCGDDLTWTLDDAGTTLTVSGTGDMNDQCPQEGDDIPAFEGLGFEEMDQITTLVLEEGMTCIGESAFSEFDSIRKVEIPDTVKVIKRQAFHDCDSLSIVEMTDSVTTIEERAFSNCESLMKVTLSKNVTRLENGVFRHCGFQSIVIPDTVKEIGREAFDWSENLTSVYIPKSVEHIESNSIVGDYLSTVVVENPECVFDGWPIYNNSKETSEDSGKLYFSGTIYAEIGSLAQVYASEENFSFMELSNAPEIDPEQSGIVLASGGVGGSLSPTAKYLLTLLVIAVIAAAVVLIIKFRKKGK